MAILVKPLAIKNVQSWLEFYVMCYKNTGGSYFIFSVFDLNSEFWVILDGVIVPALSVEHVEYGNNTYGY